MKIVYLLHSLLKEIHEWALRSASVYGGMAKDRTKHRRTPMSIQRIDAGPRMSKVVIPGGTVYLAGLTANKTVGQSLAEPSTENLSLIDSFPGKAGTDKSKLMNAT